MPGFTLDDLEAVQDRGAVGLLNPGAGPETSAELALASLVRGEVRNSLRGGAPSGPELAPTTEGELGSAAGPAIYVGLPEGGLQPNDERYPILVVGPGYEGLLTSESTRIPGLVSVVDIAPTALGERGRARLGAAGRRGGRAPRPGRADRGEQRRPPAGDDPRLRARPRCSPLFAPAAAVPGFAAALAGQPRPRDRRRLELLGRARRARARRGARRAARSRGSCARRSRSASSSPASSPPTCSRSGSTGRRSRSRRSGRPRTPATSGSRTSSRRCCSSPRSPARRSSSPRSAGPAFAGTALLAFVTVAGNRFGADGGGAIVLAAGFAVLAVLLAGGGRRALALAVGASLALALGLIGAGRRDRRLEPRHRGARGRPGRARRRPRRAGRALLGARDALWWVGLACRAARRLAFLVVRDAAAGRSRSPSSRCRSRLAAAIAVSLRRQRLARPTSCSSVRRAWPPRPAGMLRAPWPASSRSFSPSLLWSSLAGCGGERRRLARARDRDRHGPDRDGGGRRRRGRQGDPAAGKEVFASAGCGSCHTLADAGATGNVGPNLDESSSTSPLVVDAGHERRRRRCRPSAARSSEQEIADVAAYVVAARRLSLPRRISRARSTALACDLDRTLIWEDGVLRPRTLRGDRTARARPGST